MHNATTLGFQILYSVCIHTVHGYIPNHLKGTSDCYIRVVCILVIVTVSYIRVICIVTVILNQL